LLLRDRYWGDKQSPDRLIRWPLVVFRIIFSESRSTLFRIMR